MERIIQEKQKPSRVDYLKNRSSVDHEKYIALFFVQPAFFFGQTSDLIPTLPV
jgi:hypothetical protein